MMNRMNTADLISAYLHNEMSPEQERQFLLSVAASDSLRLSLKSHVMLDRIVFEQARDTRVPDGVRGAIFAEMSASLSAGGSSPSPYADGLRAAASSPGGVVAATASRFGIVKGLSIAVLALSGFGAGYLTRVGVEAPPAVQAAAVAPLLQQNGLQLQSLLASTALLVNTSLDVAVLDGEASQPVGPGERLEVTHHVRANRFKASEPMQNAPVQNSGRGGESAPISNSPRSTESNSGKPNNTPLQPNNEKPDTKISPSAENQGFTPEGNDLGRAPATVKVEDATVINSKSVPPSPKESPKQ
jgi:hypothetical protein